MNDVPPLRVARPSCKGSELATSRESVARAIASCCKLYSKESRLQYLAVANYALDYWCTALLHECCGRTAVVARDTDSDSEDEGQGARLIVRALPPAILLTDGVAFVRGLLQDFRASAHGQVTPQSIKSYTARFCNYNQLGYGLFRLAASRAGDLYAELPRWHNWRSYGICNCLVRAFVGALLAQDQGLSDEVGRVTPTRNDFLRTTQAAYAQLFPGKDHNLLPFNHLEYARCQTAGTRIRRSSSKDCAQSIYNFLLMPLDWMIVDALSREVCQQASREQVYVRHLAAFRETVLEKLAQVLPGECVSALHQLSSQEAARERDLRREHRRSMADAAFTISYPSDSEQSYDSDGADEERARGLWTREPQGRLTGPARPSRRPGRPRSRHYLQT